MLPCEFSLTVFTSPPVKLGFGLSCEYAITHADNKIASFSFRVMVSLWLPSKILVEEIDRPAPREFRGGFVITRRGVVVETVVDPIVDVRRVGDVIGLEG